MEQFELVSLDMFQTLVNLDSRTEQIWKPILGNAYALQSANECARLLLDYFYDHSSRLKQTTAFYLTEEVYKRSFESVFQMLNLTCDLEGAVKHLFVEHKQADFYEDSIGFLNRITKQYKTCIVSDADEAMIPGFYTNYGMQAFISEHYHSYKNDDQNTMFKEIINFYNIDPKKVIHIGDSVSDVAGAKREGIVTCWLNRGNKTWDHEIKPDIVIESLTDLETIL